MLAPRPDNFNFASSCKWNGISQKTSAHIISASLATSPDEFQIAIFTTGVTMFHQKGHDSMLAEELQHRRAQPFQHSLASDKAYDVVDGLRTEAVLLKIE
mmetsp:Transcript_24055/g.43561  ORF Transcript_24055/g.43561 Transcript_24055/m.43561 type:complete len:100 (-) Transcript_24055:232-531(-)